MKLFVKSNRKPYQKHFTIVCRKHRNDLCGDSMSKFRRVSPALGVWGEHENLCGADGLFLFLGIEESLAYGKITLSSKFTFMRHCMSTSSSRFEFWGKFHNVIDSRKKYLSTSKKVETKNFPKTYKKLPIRKIFISHGRPQRKTNIKNRKIK